MNALVGALIVILSWWLNAVADAIDHGKGSRTLYELWHIVKVLSYFLPFGYIVIIERWPVWLFAAACVLGYGWQIIYRYLRKHNIQELDDRIKIPWLAWLLGIKHIDGK